MRPLRGFTLVIVLLLAWPGLSLGQAVSATTGAMNGKVTDASAGVMPGVTVTVTSSAMQGTQTVVTNTEGAYRFPALPPGDYKITYVLPGFATVIREGIHIGLGFTATVNVGMKVAGVAESVTVSGASPVVDTLSTRTATAFDAKLLAAIPSARDMWSVLAEAPAVQVTRIDVGGSTAGTQTGYNAYDARGGQNRVMIDGLVTTEGTDAIGVYVDYGAFDEISIGTAGHSSEMGWPGVQTQFIAKSGGNTYHGSLYGDYQNKGIQGRNISDEQRSRGITFTEANRLHSYRDFNADVGGYIKKDKIWWYGSYRNFDVRARYANFPVKPHQTALQHYTGKATFALPGNNKLVLFNSQTRKFQPTRLDAFRVSNAINTSEVTTQNQTHWAWVRKVEWNKVVSSTTFVEVRGGTFGYDWPLVPNGTLTPRVEDLVTNAVTGSNRDWIQSRRRHQVLGTLSYYKEGWYGDHSFKIGGEIFNETFDERFFESSYGNHGAISYTRSGVPSEVDLLEVPGVVRGGLWTYSAHANDAWKVTERLTLLPGLRFDRYRSYLPDQEHAAGFINPTAVKYDAVDNVITWNLIGPRVGVTYDLTDQGKTVLKFNFGRYWWNPSVLTGINPNKSPWYKRYRWTDSNSNGYWDPGEQYGAATFSQGGAADGINPNLKDTYTTELNVGVDREVMANLGVHTGFVYRGIRQRYTSYNQTWTFADFNVPVTIPDAGADGVIGNADDEQPIAGFNLTPSLVGKISNIFDNGPAQNDYYTWEISANRRKVGRWSLMASYTIRFNHDDANAFFGNTVRQNALPRNPNDLINTASDGTYHYVTWTAKVNSVIDLPWGDVRVTPMIRHQSGQPFGRTILYSFNYGANIRVLAEPLDTRRQDPLTIVDIRAEKVFRLAGARSVSLFLDVYNITNTNAEQNINWSSGSAFLRPSTIVPPRIGRLGAKFNW
jgi:hypothetical protein